MVFDLFHQLTLVPQKICDAPRWTPPVFSCMLLQNKETPYRQARYV